MMQSKKNSITHDDNRRKRIAKNFVEWSFNIICFVLVLLALLMAIASISRSTDQEKYGVGIASLGNITYAPVFSDSMEPEIMKGDLAVGTKYNGQELKVGNIISFRTIINGKPALNTHKIIEIVLNSDNTLSYVKTKGINSKDVDLDPVYKDDIVSIYKTKYSGLGKPILWLQSDPQHFFLGVVLPIILLFVIYAAIFIRALVNAALGKKRLSASTVDGLSEEDKKKLAEEYLAKLEEEKKQQDKTNTQDSVVDNKEDSKTAEDSSSDK